MYQSRLVNRKISISEKIADLPLAGQLLYTWAIPQADDFGLLQASARTMKAQIIPMLDINTADVENIINQMIENGLWQVVEYQGVRYYKIAKFEENQRYRKDIQPYSILPITWDKDIKKSWELFEEIKKKLTPKSTKPETPSTQDVDTTDTSRIRDGYTASTVINLTKLNRTRQDILLTPELSNNSIAGEISKNTGEEKNQNLQVREKETDYQPAEGLQVILQNGHVKSESDVEPTPIDVLEGVNFLKKLLGLELKNPLPKDNDNRQAYVRLFRLRGKINIFKVMIYGRSVSGEKGFPVITNYLDLEQKWESLIIATKRKVDDMTLKRGIDLSEYSP